MNDVGRQAGKCIEPLAELVGVAWDLAPQYCMPEHGCMDYHRSWGLVRLLLGEGRLPAGESFFQRELARIVGPRRLRVLISGGADSGLSALVLRASRAMGVEPELVFADRCLTACEINARFAQSVGARMQIVEGDVCDLNIEPVDVVIAHSFLPFFEGLKRQQVIDAWYRSLCAGGRVLASNVLRASEADWITKKSPEALQEQAQKLFERAVDSGYGMALAQEMVKVAEQFWRLSPSRPPGLTEKNLRHGLETAGFISVEINYSDAGVNEGPMAMVRTKLDGKARAEIMALK